MVRPCTQKLSSVSSQNLSAYKEESIH